MSDSYQRRSQTNIYLPHDGYHQPLPSVQPSNIPHHHQVWCDISWSSAAKEGYNRNKAPTLSLLYTHNIVPFFSLETTYKKDLTVSSICIPAIFRVKIILWEPLPEWTKAYFVLLFGWWGLPEMKQEKGKKINWW